MAAFISALVFLLLLSPQAQHPEPQQQAAPPPVQRQSSAGGVPASAPKFHVVRCVSGSNGVQQNGSYVIRDPRTIFYVPQDQHVIVYFEWDGPAGLHHFEGVWKNPEGKASAISDFDYEAKQSRFGGYWEMLMSATTEPGLWTLEARVDGEVTGTYSFQIIAEAKPASTAPERLVLTNSEIYQRALASTAIIDSLNAKGDVTTTGLGFSVGQGLILTAFQVIDGANSLRLTLPGGRSLEAHDVAAWNRRQDWAILRIDDQNTPDLKLAKPGSWSVGDRALYLDSEGGSKVIVETGIVGKNSFLNSGDRLNLQIGPSSQGNGTALLNEYGEVIGIVGGSLVPGVPSIEGSRYGFPTNILGARAIYRGAMATPIEQVVLPASDARTSTLAELAQTGQFLPPLVDRQDILTGTLARSVVREHGIIRAVDERFEYSRKDGRLAILLTFTSKKRQKGAAGIVIYDLDNHLVARTLPSKLQLQAGGTMYWSDQLNLSNANLPSAIYRLDVVLDGSPIWRTFFQITD